MTYATAKAVPDSMIPVIDIASLRSGEDAAFQNIADEVLAAASSVGFFYIKNHGIDQALIDKVLTVSRTFFELDDNQKQSVTVNPSHHGLLTLGEATMEGSATTDLKESYIWGREYNSEQLDALGDNPLAGPNQWPTYMPEMKPLFNEYFEACIVLGQLVLRVFEICLGTAPGYISGQFDHTISRASSLYYPPQLAAMGDKQFGVAPHTDYGTLTLLYQDDIGGLQVYGKDGWITAKPIADTYVVNVGDLLHRWTNGLFASTPHRVVNASSEYRQSLAVFIDPNFETEITPVVQPNNIPQFEPISCGEYIQRRMDGSFDYRNFDFPNPHSTNASNDET